MKAADIYFFLLQTAASAEFPLMTPSLFNRQSFGCHYLINWGASCGPRGQCVSLNIQTTTSVMIGGLIIIETQYINCRTLMAKKKIQAYIPSG